MARLLYAQERRGQKLHLVVDLGGGFVSEPLCGRRVSRWYMTINVPLGRSCKNCRRCTERRVARVRLDAAQRDYALAQKGAPDA